MLTWIGGVALQLQQPSLWSTRLNLACAAAGVLGVTLALIWRRRGSHLLLCVALALTAFGTTAWRAEQRLAAQLSPALESRNLLATGTIDRMPQLASDGVRFVFAVSSASLDGHAVSLPPLLALSWSRTGDDGSLAAPHVDLRAGQRWQLPLRLRRPHAAMNPHGFDGELWLFEQGFGATGIVRNTVAGPQPQQLGGGAWRPIERTRQAVRDALLLRVGDARIAGVLAALAVGDQAAIARDDWDLFRDSGVAHLMSISGVHITMFAWLAGGLVAWGWRRSARACLWWPAPQAGQAGGLLAAALYALLAGFGVPAQRTLLMLAAAVALRTRGAHWPWPLVLMAAAVAVTAADPWALLQAGFWLSFAAVGLLMASDPLQPDAAPVGTLTRLRAGLRKQAIATLGLAPLSLAFFHQVSLVGFVANLVAIPWVTLIVTPLSLAGVVLPWLWQAAAAAAATLIGLLQALTASPAAVWSVPAAPTWAIVAGLTAALLGLLPLPWRLRALALPLAVPLLLPAVTHPVPGRFELMVLDIGQGTAVLVRTHSHLLLYDTGPAYARDADAGQRVIVPLLRARGEQRIDLLMLSHRDSDHVGGAGSVGAALPVAGWSTSLGADHPLLAGVSAHRRCDAGQRWQWDGVAFEVLHPDAADYAAAATPNAISCVLRVSDAAGRTALLTGDIEAPQETALVARLGPALRSTLLLVPHHGSKTSSSDAFVDAVQPQVALVQAGYRSRFGHPAPEVEARYLSRGIMLVRSDHCGAWSWSDAAFE
ncbi:MAG TPA: DNA internalization-related competence protein ComEC/Rec2, partial [Burkholderiaceae bacterium]|nr:DNA internalization-related competence protein ComEC/Rec2 [Burkholderiaceae bacterium]